MLCSVTFKNYSKLLAELLEEKKEFMGLAEHKNEDTMYK